MTPTDPEPSACSATFLIRARIKAELVILPVIFAHNLFSPPPAPPPFAHLKSSSLFCCFLYLLWMFVPNIKKQAAN